MLKIKYKKVDLVFKNPAGTSRGTLHTKPSWFLILQNTNNDKISMGECSIIPKLSIDDLNNYEEKLNTIIHTINDTQSLEHQFDFSGYPSIKFGYEMMTRDYHSKEDKILFESDFTKGNFSIPINGLIWMGDKDNMFKQIKLKLNDGWQCLKLKIGAIDFEEELNLLKYVRKQFRKDDLELRVDANGAFKPHEALKKLDILSKLDIHSIEQPIKAGQIENMSQLCEKSPLPIALDEELIGVFGLNKKRELLQQINPQYIILKPSLLGGWQESDEWIESAKRLNIGYWATSALESNIGLNAIAQWIGQSNDIGTQGLGTGQIYRENVSSPLVSKSGYLKYDVSHDWNFGLLEL